MEEEPFSFGKNVQLEDLNSFFKDIEDGVSLMEARKKHKVYTNRNELIQISKNQNLQLSQKVLTKRPVRSWSGVVVITVVMRPDKFSCPYNCHYCPNEPGQPRSYLSNEPAVARANEEQFDVVKQVYSRINTLEQNGHKIDKIEIIILGGTFSTYPKDYQYEFIRDLFYAANNTPQRKRLTLNSEHLLNETADRKIIGVTIETRPDQITKEEIRRLRSYGVTRVQIGVQHTDNEILQYLNRGHKVQHSVNAIRLLRDNGFKVDVHIMPDLPGSNPEKDKIMIQKILEHPDFIPDYLKIYPCLDVDFTEIRKWKQTGKWIPYADSDDGTKIRDVVIYAKRLSKEYIRFNRIQRDFSEESNTQIGYISKNIKNNFRQMLEKHLKLQNVVCKCIRCREIKNEEFDVNTIFFKTYRYITNGGTEFFVSANVNDKLLGFIRVRIPEKTHFMAYEFMKHNYAFIRELHVYGQLVPTKEKTKEVQNLGLGKKLLSFAEYIAFINNKTNVCVISGVGVRNFYRKQGYSLESEGHYLIKQLVWTSCLKQRLKLFNLNLKRNK